MKKFFAAMGLMMAAIVSLVSCQPKEIFSETRTMTITASSDLTKTTNDGMSTLWAEGDQLHVFYSNGSTYEKAGVFTLSEGIGSKTGTFTGEVASTPSAATTWYAIYTGSSSAAPLTPAASAAQDGFIYLGRSNGITQPAYDDMARVSSSHCPMYGIAENVPASGTPAFAMKQLASVIEFDVVNKTGKSLIISSLELKELTDVAGQYLLDITGSEPVLTPVEGKTITNPVVKITNPAELAANAVAKLYIPVKPFKHTTEAGMQVVVSGKVNDAEGSKTISLNPVGDAQCTFAAGKIKKVTVNVTELDVVTPADHTFIFNTSEGLGKLGIAVPEAGGNTTLNGETFTDRASGVSISFDKGSATTDCRIWCTAGGELDLRVYNKSSMTITAPSGYSVTKIVFDVGVAYDANVDLARKILHRIIRETNLISKEMAPLIYIKELADSSVNFSCEVYVGTISNRKLTLDYLCTRTLSEFRKAGIEIPFNQLDVNVKTLEKEEFIEKLKQGLFSKNGIDDSKVLENTVNSKI